MKTQLKNMIFSIILILAFQCGGSGTTIVGNPTTTGFDVDESKVTYSGVSGTSMTVTATSDAVTFPTGTSSSDLIVSILVNGALATTLTNSDFNSSTLQSLSTVQPSHQTSNLFSTSVTASSGSVITTIFSIGATSSNVVLSGTSSANATNPSKASSTTSTTDSTTISTGTTAFSNQNLSSAESTFCNAYLGGSTNSQVAFGCFLAKYIRLLETTDATTILTSLQEPSIDVQTLILDGIFQNPVDQGGPDQFVYTDYASLPLNTIFRSALNKNNKIGSLLQRLVNSSTTASQLQTELEALVDDFEFLEGTLSVVLSDANFSFTIPAETFYTNNDLLASFNDARLLMANVKASIVALNFQAAYDLGVDLDLFVMSGTIDHEVLVEDLNGSGATVNTVTVDNTPFLTLTSASKITNNKTRFEESMDYLQQAMSSLAGGASSDLFDDSLNRANLSNIEDLASDLLTSSQSSGFVSISLITKRSVRINMNQFFSNPPSASNVTGSDPFVYNMDSGLVNPVESYFDSFLNNIAIF